MKEFDTAKGAFYLIAIIIGTQMVLSIIIVGGCMVGRFEEVFAQGTCRGIMPEMREIFQQCFTAAIAFAGGRMSAPSSQGPKLPEKN